MKHFIGIYPNAVTDEVCSKFVKTFNILSEHKLTLSSQQDGREAYQSPNIRDDEVMHIPSDLPPEMLMMPHDCFPTPISNLLWDSIKHYLDIYVNEYNLLDESLTSNGFKIHRVQPSGGYHAWHHEHGYPTPYRVLAWHLTIEAPTKGGETEFLHQSMRLNPEVGTLAIWPAGFTHKHRGNPPLEGQKTYITGWFEVKPSNVR